MTKIKLGNEIGSGTDVFISPSHLIVTGITQQSGKTTTLEALIQRSSLKAIVFKTKPGEKSFTSGTVVAPFFRDRSDYEFVRSLIEAYSREKLFIEKGTLMNLCKGSKNLIEIKRRIDDELATKKLRGIKEEIYTRLQHYLENLIPQIQYAKFSSVLNIVDGVNIMDLEKFSDEAQSLIIRSVADEVLKTSRDTIIVIPEAWKFIPQRHNNPCKQAVESYVRQGAGNNNFVWIDSQDMSGVDKTPLKQISTWILGYQSERNEVKHTLDQINLTKKQKPSEDSIMKLSIGQFILSTREKVVKVYVQPIWVTDEQSWKIATDKMDLQEAILSKPMPALNIPTHKAPGTQSNGNPDQYATKKELTALRMDFFTKMETTFAEVQNFLNNLQQGSPNSVGQKIDEDHIVSLVLQKMPQKKILDNNNSSPANTDAIIAEVLKRIPKSTGNITYEVAPLEKIKKDFLREVKDKILQDVSELSKDEKKLLKYMETKEGDVTSNEAMTKCFFLKMGGSASAKISKLFAELISKDFVEKTAGGRFRKNIAKMIESLMGNHNATDEEKSITYNHILAGLID